MSESLKMRATSFAASAFLLGAVVVAAFSVTITLQSTNAPQAPALPFVEIQPPDPPPVTRRPRTPPPVAPPSDPADAAPPDQPLPTEVSDAGPAVFAPPGPELITSPRWLRQPRDLGNYYPTRALAREIAGQVVLDCIVDVNGALSCVVVSETPANWEFGQAALRISRDYRMVPAMRNGQAVEARYRMRVPFDVR